MSLDSRADIIPYARFVDVRQRRQAIAATSTPTLLPTDVDVRPESPVPAIDGVGAAAEAPNDSHSIRYP